MELSYEQERVARINAENAKVKRVIKIIIGSLIGVILFFGAFTIVSPQEIGIVTRAGALNRSLSEGFHFKIPFVEGVTKMKIQEQKLTVDSQVYSKDAQTVDTKLTVNYQLKRESVEKVFRETRNNYQDIIINPVMSPAIEEVFSKFTAQELVERRSELPVAVKNAVIERVGEKGILIKGVEFTFDFDDQYENAIRNKQVQEQQALAQKNITAQEEEKKKQEILKAEALAERTRLEAVALQSAQGDKVIAKIYAEAALEAAKKWNGALPQQMIPNSTLPFIQVGQK